MTPSTFWSLIAKSKADPDALQAVLRPLPEPDILAFDRIFREMVAAAYRNELWAVAYIMNGGCSDDGFEYFLAWLIGRGRKTYEAALLNPEAAATGVGPDDEPFENESLAYAAAAAYEEKTRKSDFHDRAVSTNLIATGQPWKEEDLASTYPALAKKFGM